MQLRPTKVTGLIRIAISALSKTTRLMSANSVISPSCDITLNRLVLLINCIHFFHNPLYQKESVINESIEYCHFCHTDTVNISAKPNDTGAFLQWRHTMNTKVRTIKIYFPSGVLEVHFSPFVFASANHICVINASSFSIVILVERMNDMITKYYHKIVTWKRSVNNYINKYFYTTHRNSLCIIICFVSNGNFSIPLGCANHRICMRQMARSNRCTQPLIT